VAILYLTYDGLRNHISQSQVLPYLFGLSDLGFKFIAVSPEAAKPAAANPDKTSTLLREKGIGWRPSRFRSQPPLIAKILDQLDLDQTAARAFGQQQIQAVHARSYVPAWTAWKLKQKFHVPFVFDMRGFWPDQRREGGRWPANHPILNAVYKTWKNRERLLIRDADHIVVLTQAARDEIVTWPDYRGAPITVIPCVTNYEHMPLRTAQSRLAARARLSIPADATVLAYLGSTGSVYLLEDMLRFFVIYRERNPSAVLFFVGTTPKEMILATAKQAGLKLADHNVFVSRAIHEEVGALLAAADVGLCFITPTYSSKGVSPTKLGEYLAVGLPVIANDGIGDVTSILAEGECGLIIPDLSATGLAASADRVAPLLHMSPLAIRETSYPTHHLGSAIERYDRVYRSLGITPAFSQGGTS
jgi:glycosyltransferase involved in cell wall biosynthesis